MGNLYNDKRQNWKHYKRFHSKEYAEHLLQEKLEMIGGVL